MLKVENLSFGYDEDLIFENISFNIEKGKVLGLLGKNGAGKTTLFKCILGLLKAREGKIKVNNLEINNISYLERAKSIAYIPQSHYPTFNHDVLNVVEMGGNVRAGKFNGLKQEEKDKAYKKLELLGIEKLASRGYKEISGGERQLVLIARALMQEAKVLVMDEPTANLDYGNQILILNRCQELSKLGYTIIQSTHNPQYSYMFFDDVLVLDNKGILTMGNPKEVLTERVLKRIYNIDLHIEKLFYKNNEEYLLIPEYDI